MFHGQFIVFYKVTYPVGTKIIHEFFIIKFFVTFIIVIFYIITNVSNIIYQRIKSNSCQFYYAVLCKLLLFLCSKNSFSTLEIFCRNWFFFFWRFSWFILMIQMIQSGSRFTIVYLSNNFVKDNIVKKFATYLCFNDILIGYFNFLCCKRNLWFLDQICTILKTNLHYHIYQQSSYVTLHKVLSYRFK